MGSSIGFLVETQFEDSAGPMYPTDLIRVVVGSGFQLVSEARAYARLKIVINMAVAKRTFPHFLGYLFGSSSIIGPTIIQSTRFL